jgi:hypothetical protein
MPLTTPRIRSRRRRSRDDEDEEEDVATPEIDEEGHEPILTPDDEDDVVADPSEEAGMGEPTATTTSWPTMTTTPFPSSRTRTTTASTKTSPRAARTTIFKPGLQPFGLFEAGFFAFPKACSRSAGPTSGTSEGGENKNGIGVDRKIALTY